MKVYLVGGAVRDMRLGLKVKDHDFVVVGSTPEEMLSLGFGQVGSDFPVFIHPVTRDEYALARTERKSGSGYHGFTVDASPDVTLEEDLERRDLTINAMAHPVEVDMKTGNFEIDESFLIDPFSGKLDLMDGTLRHVSDAFKDDPVRVLRVARFAARYGFSVDFETLVMMEGMVENGELNHLTAERVWLELDKVLGEETPTEFFHVLRACDAMKVVFPEVHALFGVPQPEQWHPEIDTGVHTMMVLEQACKMTDDKRVRFAALVHDLGKAITPEDKLPSHPGHEEDGVPIVEAMCDRLKIPNEFRELAVKVCRYHLHAHKAFEMKPKTIEKVFAELDLYRKPELFQPFLDAVEADARGRLGLEHRNYFQRVLFEQAFIGAQRVVAQPFVEKGLKGKDIGEAMRIERIDQIRRRVNKLKPMLKEDT